MSVDPFTAPLVGVGADMGFVGNPFDRADEVRRDAARLAVLRRARDSRWLLLVDLKPVMSTEGGVLDLLWLPPDDLPEITDWVFLGFRGDAPHFAASVAPGGFVPGRPLDARGAAIQLGDSRSGIIAQARSLLSWHATHGHCAVCGAPTEAIKGGYCRRCTAAGCGAEHFPRTDPVVIMLVVDGERCLLGRQPAFPAGFYSALAGFVEPGESLEEAVRREVAEEAGVRVGRVRYVASQPWPFPSSLMIGCFGEALSTDITVDAEELEEARWYSRAEVLSALRGEGPFTAPPPIAIAHHLLKAWAELG
ncbi:NAD(+) diphosphatase [Parapedomonas caeni]